MLDMMSIRFMLTIIELIGAIIFYIIFIIKKEKEYAYCSFGNIFLITVTVLAMYTNGTNWIFAY